jgi:hypothetical protein
MLLTAFFFSGLASCWYDSFEDEERKVLYKVVLDSQISIAAELSNLVDEKESSLRDIITGIKSKIEKNSAQLLFGDLKGQLYSWRANIIPPGVSSFLPWS